MEEIQAALIETFLEEAGELLTELEGALLELEKDPSNRDVVDRVFRVMHTLKGNAAMFGFEKVETFTHDIETVYDMVREGRLAVSAELVDLTLAARDVIATVLADDTSEENHEVAEKILVRFHQLAAPVKGENPEERRPAAGPSLPDRWNQVRTYRIRFDPEPGLFRTGTNPLGILAELRELGSCVLSADMRNIPTLETIDPENCYLSWDILLNTDAEIDRVEEAFLFVADRAQVRIDAVDGPGDDPDAEAGKRLGDILVERGEVTREQLERVLGEQRKLGQDLVMGGLVDPEAVEVALAEQQMINEARTARSGADSAATMRVASAKLDGLVDLVGELVTVQARLSQMVLDRNDAELLAVAEEVESLTWELRDNAFSIRVIPIETAFNRIRRLVRDLSRDLGQDVELITEGGETELDKTVVEKLTDPLMHLIRNCVDHGIEPPEERAAAGKSRQGGIRLSALQSGADVVLEVSDDGRGIDVEAVRARAVARGLVGPEADLSAAELYAILFSPGFSTTQNVTSVSGRGVGLDVVKRSIESLRGSIVVESTPGQGTTFIVRLPLTLAIIDGLLMELGDERYVVPLHLVEECVHLPALDPSASGGRRLLNVRDELVPFIDLRDWFGINGAVPERRQVVIIRDGDERVGLAVDTVVGEHQTVIKNLGRIYRDAEGVAGATILGDGTVSLILDVARIIGQVRTAEQASLQSVR